MSILRFDSPTNDTNFLRISALLPEYLLESHLQRFSLSKFCKLVTSGWGAYLQLLHPINDKLSPSTRA